MRAPNGMMGLVYLFSLGLAGCSAGTDPSSDEGTGKGGASASGGAMSGGSTGISGGSGGGSSAGTGGGVSSAGSGGVSTASGGTSSAAGGGAGSGGLAGGPPHVVEPCAEGDDLPRGVWDNVTPPDIDLGTSGTLALALDPTDSRILYLGSMKRGVYKSTDCAATWSKLDTGEQSSEIDKGNNNHLLVDSSNTQVMYVTAGYGGPGGIMKSTNGGVDFHQTLSEEAISVLYGGGFIESLSMDPSNPAHLVTIPHGPCSGDYGPGGCFAESTDSGATWKLGKGSPAWDETQNLEVISSSTWLVGEIFGDKGIWRTGDGGVTWQQASTKNGAAFHKVADGTIYAAGPGGVLKSTDDGVSWADVANGPKSSVITGDGTSIYVNWDKGYFSAAEADDTNWSQFEVPAEMSAGVCLPTFFYDQDHLILYSTNCSGGFWRATVP